MMATPFTAPVDAKLACDGLQIVNPPVTRVVAHSLKGFLLDAHTLNSVIYDTIYQSEGAIP